MKKLSQTQQAMLARLAECDHELTPGGMGRDTGRIASAWNRTADALIAKGLAESPYRPYPCARMVRITDAGREALATTNHRDK